MLVYNLLSRVRRIVLVSLVAISLAIFIACLVMSMKIDAWRSCLGQVCAFLPSRCKTDDKENLN